MLNYAGEEVAVAAKLADVAMDCSSRWHTAAWSAGACCTLVWTDLAATAIFWTALDFALLAPTSPRRMFEPLFSEETWMRTATGGGMSSNWMMTLLNL